MNMNRIYVKLHPIELQALLDLASYEYRNPHQQAAILIREGLKQRGYLNTEINQNFEHVDKEENDREPPRDR